MNSFSSFKLMNFIFTGWIMYVMEDFLASFLCDFSFSSFGLLGYKSLGIV